MLDHRTHTFLTVYRERSFTKAAASLMVTQPAVSQHIRQIEAHYGVPLFVKTGRGIEPTRAGDALYQRLQTMACDERRILEEMARLSGSTPRTAPLRLGCTRTIADFIAPDLIARHLSHHPDAPVPVVSGNTRELVLKLDQGDVDLALVEGSFDRGRFSWETFSHEPYIAIGRSGMRSPASIRDLLSERLIVREAGSGSREILEKHLAARDLSLDDFAETVEIASIPTIKACVAAGAGVAFMYGIAAERELASGELSDITPRDFEMEHDFCLIWQRGSQFASRYRALCDTWRRGGTDAEADAAHRLDGRA
ncbi:MAG: LysR family transcriptional regulator [Collinsella sp.]|nr:LysR family transcriptional regulator [Collinsella sp.]